MRSPARAGISQPYLFRLFGTKKELFLAVIDACFAETLESFRAAASGKSGEEALDAMGRGVQRPDRERPDDAPGQLQCYAASVEDDEIREAPLAATAHSSTTSRRVSGADRRTLVALLRQRHAAERPDGDGVLDRRRPERLVGRSASPRAAAGGRP